MVCSVYKLFSKEHFLFSAGKTKQLKTQEVTSSQGKSCFSYIYNSAVAQLR